MFLKRLEIIGFKSFAERICVDFVPGVTAIVGPNGSGKSNITDAIRWVLGEQSAKSLRGSKMEDVIFAGSDSRKPLNFAEVTLVLDNSKGLFPLDYTDISVSRRVFRSGESVYLLNGLQCRLKDITDVFMDSGLGKEAFSIISQGRVDEILNSRPEDRRSIFDEAAGVLKYRTRKRKAEHKLYETSDNLDRVLDILKELETRIEPLKIHAEAAEKHTKYAEEMREIDVTLLNYDAQTFALDMKGMLKEADKLRSKEQQLIESTEVADKETSQIKGKLKTVEIDLEALQKKLVDISTETEKWEGRRLLSAEKERNTGRQIERIESELTSAEKGKIVLDLKLTEAQDRLETTQQDYEKVSGKINNISQILKRSVKETENEIEELKSTYIDKLNEEATLRNELKHIEERLVGEKSSSERIIEQKAILTERIKKLTAEKKIKQQSLIKLEQSFKETQSDFNKTMSSLSQQEDKLRMKQELLQKAYNRQHEMQGRMRALQSMEADFSGFFTGVKEVLVAKKSGKLAGINGAVAELISVDNTYIKAIETALGGAMQHIVTSTEAEARKAIGFLKAKNAGRATFLPLDVMRSRKIQQTALKSIEQHPHFIGTADQLVKTTAAYKIITEHLLGNVIVASSLQGASEISKALNYRYRIVTTDGDIVNAGGSLTGGGVTSRASVFTRKAELETLQSQLVEMATSIESATVTVGDSKMVVAELMEKSQKLRKLTETIQLEIAAMESGIRETDIALHSSEVEAASIEVGRRGAEATGSELYNKKIELEKNHIAIKDLLDQLKNDVELLERFAIDWRNEEAAHITKLTGLRERAAVLREQKGYQKSTIGELEIAVNEANEKIKQLSEEIQFFTGDGGVEELTAKEIEAKIEESVLNKNKIEAAIKSSRETRLNLSAEIVEKEMLLKKTRSLRDEVSAQYNKVTVSLSRMEVNYEAIIQRLYNEYGLNPDTDLLMDVDESLLREKLRKLKLTLEEIGPVNPNAIKEFKDVSERFTFLSEQRNDLIEAKKTLQDAMSEMDIEMTARFSTTFNAVRNRFRDVFKEMFGGGDADLVLTNPENLLETGVDIVARPPGKKLQNLSLLSGGERALTAISLLFSIIEVRPVPFCILDEVEAALDETNVARYSRYLKKFSERTQFIVITHRKGTMEGADVLYGITMQESGVSKLISVNISEVPGEAIIEK